MIILSTVNDKNIKSNKAEIIFCREKDLADYQNNPEVEIIVTSRAGASLCASLDFPSLKLIQLQSAGYDGVPIKAFKEKSVIVCNAGDVYSVPIAETIVFSLLRIYKRYNKSPKNSHIRIQRNYKYIDDISGKRVLICGAGNIGMQTAIRLKGFNCNLSGFDISDKNSELFNEFYSDKNRLKSILSDFDIIISTLPDNDKTKLFWNDEMLNRINSEAVFINVGRRATIDENCLYKKLKSKSIGFAVLDMFSPLPCRFTNKFYRCKNAVILPGVAAISKQSRSNLAKLINLNIYCVINGKTPINQIMVD